MMMLLLLDTSMMNFKSIAKTDIATKVGEMAVQAIRDAGEQFKFRCELDGEYNVGTNWAETH